MALPSIDESRVKYFHATWTGLVSLLDGIDPDDQPDLDALSGTITITTQQPTLLLFGGPQPFSLWPARRDIKLADGFGSVALESNASDTIPKAWRWQARFNVSYKGVLVNVPNAIFMAGDGEIIDLTSFIGRA